MVLIRPRPSLVNSRFLKYWLNSPAIVSHIRGFRDGSVAERLNLPTIRGLPIALPPLSEQERTADTLGCLDDKIELNRRMNRTLKSIARAIFKSWFVDFDPVLEKMEGKSDDELGLPPSLADTFPSAMTSTAGTEHPEGWKCRELGDLVSERTQRVGSSREAVVLSAVSSGQLVRSDDHFNKQVYSKNLGKYKAVLRNDFAYNPSRINIGSIGMLQEDVLGAVSPVYVVFTPRQGYADFVDFLMREGSTQAWIGQLSSGSVRQSLTYRDLATIPVIIPGQESVAAFDNVLASVRASSEALEAQTSTLCRIRDELLPRLMSGEAGTR
jgi:type I restriction enzyme S subunit